MGFYQQITTDYGANTTLLMKRWSSFNTKLANKLNRRNFLLRCRRSNILPRHIQDSTKTMNKLFQPENWKIAEEMRRHVRRLSNKNLNLEIKECYYDLSNLKNNIISIQGILKNTLPNQIYNEYCRRLDIAYNKRFSKIKNVHLKKFTELQQKVVNDRQKMFVNNEKWFKNISDVDIPSDIVDFLSLGSKFGIAPTGKNLNVKRFLADVENIIVEHPDEDQNILRAQITNNITNFLSHSANQKLTTIQKQFFRTKHFLKSNPNLYIVQADKGGCTVAMNKHDYSSKLKLLLEDCNTYTLLSKDPIPKLQRTLNELIKACKLTNELSEEDAKYLTVYHSTAAKLYGLPKIHKDNVPLRPIVSCINFTTYNLAKFLCNILTDALGDRSNINVPDTFSFVNSIRNVTLPHNYVLVSLDVVSLFTNIPSGLVKTLLGLHWPRISQHTKLSKTNFFKLFSLVYDNCFFSFENKVYHQISGSPMGSPISPILAQIAMDHLLEKITSKLPFKLPFIYKYIDDIITSIPAGQEDHTLDIFNSVNTHIKFTMERENNCSVPFLDTLLLRSMDNKLILNWYQKPTSSGRYINYFSNHPMTQKVNTVIAMKNRIMHISDEKFLKTNLKKLLNIFLNNGYPKRLLNRLIFNTSFYDGALEAVTTNDIKYKKLPYVPKLTEDVIKRLKHNSSNIRIAKYNSITVGDIFSKTKEKTPLMQTSNIVYKIPCKHCDSVYVGQTTQSLKQRITQHKSDTRIGKKSCALSIHARNSGHIFDYENARILEIENNYRKRLFLEMVHINLESKSINSRADINQLSTIYCNILKNN